MKLVFALFSGLVAAVCFTISTPVTVEGFDSDASPIFGIKLPDGYRDWRLISVAHEAGDLNDIRAVLGNEIALKAYREEMRPFPDGAIIARLAWKYAPSDENNAVFGQPQSFVAGPPTNIQFSVKDSKKFGDTSGWGYAQFEGGKPNQSETLIMTCAACHARAPEKSDRVFTHYAP